MTSDPNRSRSRPRDIVSALGRAYPSAWEAADRMRSMRGRELPAWPDWCYLPLHGAYATVSGGGSNRVPFERSHHTGILGALTAWRMTQGIYRYDPVLYSALVSTPIDGELPVDPLYRLPEWCVYVETPDMQWTDVAGARAIRGVWAHLDWTDTAADELRLVLDTADDIDDPLNPWTGLIPIPIILGEGGLAAGIERVIESGSRQAITQGMRPIVGSADDVRRTTDILTPIVSLVLYLCAESREIDGAGQPGNPAPTRTRHGWRLFAADRPRNWEVGVRIGAALRRAYQARETAPDRVDDAAGGISPRPHIRRAHWHGFWRGPRRAPGQRTLALRWLPPIAVNVDDAGAMPAVIKRVDP